MSLPQDLIYFRKDMTANLKPYPSYKSSSVEWLGEVPAHWEVRRLKQAVALMMGQSPPGSECSEKPIGLPFLQGCAEFGERHPSPVQFCRTPQKVSPTGSILLSVRAPVGRLNIADQEYGIGRGLCALLPHKRVLQTAFARYHLEVLEHGLRLASTGSTYDAVSVGDVGNQPVFVPPLAEQAAIVRYLRSRERLIELLKEYRQAVIHEAVTRGLDPDVPLKPSGVEWLGDVPAHWEVRRVKDAFRRIVGGATPSSSEAAYWDGAIVWVTPTDVSKVTRLRNSLRRITKKGLNACSAKLVPAGSLVVTSRAPVGNVALAEVPLCTNQGCKSLIPESRVMDSTYGYQVFGRLQDELQSLANGTTFTEISTNALENVLLPIPPLAEQAVIVRYLDKQAAAIDAAMSRAQREIELLGEYRTRLIADVVTGQVDVREVARLPDDGDAGELLAKRSSLTTTPSVTMPVLNPKSSSGLI